MTIPTIAGRHYVAGQWLPPGPDTFPSRSPANRNTVVGVFPRGTPAVANDAVAAAKAAFGPWRRTSRIHRAECSTGWPSSSTARRTLWRPSWPASAARRSPSAGPRWSRGCTWCSTSSAPAGCRSGDIVASEIAEKDAFVRRKPWGVVAVITPWNFPFAVPLWMLGPSPARRQHGRLQAVGGHARRSASGWSSCSSRPASRRGRSTSSTARAGRRGSGPQPGCQRACCSPAVTRSAGASSSCRRTSRTASSPPRWAARAPSSSATTPGSTWRSTRPSSAPSRRAASAACRRAGSSSPSRLSTSSPRIRRHRAKRLRIGDPLDPHNFTGPVINENAVEKVVRLQRAGRRRRAQRCCWTAAG